MKNLIVTFATSVVLLAGCAQDIFNTKPEVRGLEGAAPLQTLTDPASGTQITLRVGGQLRLELDANATTGYMWQVTQLDEDTLSLISDEYVSDAVPEGLVGAGGTQIFVFQALKDQSSDLEVRYQRSPDDVADILTIHVKIAS
ncbi:MAG: protease inhibitor I42 family protein [Pseudomonadota bacterium]